MSVFKPSVKALNPLNRLNAIFVSWNIGSQNPLSMQLVHEFCCWLVGLSERVSGVALRQLPGGFPNPKARPCRVSAHPAGRVSTPADPNNIPRGEPSEVYHEFPRPSASHTASSPCALPCPQVTTACSTRPLEVPSNPHHSTSHPHQKGWETPGSPRIQVQKWRLN